MALNAGFSQLGYYFQTYGIMDFLLPFLLVFTIVYAVLQKAKILGDNRHFNIIVSLVIGLLFVVPHVMGYYPLGFDPVAVMNDSLPSIALVAVGAVMLLILMGVFGANFSKAAAPWIAIASIAFVIYIFGSSLSIWTGPSQVFGWWDSSTTEVLLILVVFGLIVWFIVKEPGDKSKGERFLKGVGKLFERRGNND